MRNLRIDMSKIDFKALASDLSDIEEEKEINNLGNGVPEVEVINARTERKYDDPLITLTGKRICSIGNGTMIIAPPGTGKSNVCEAIAASVVSSNCDALGFKHHPVDNRGVLYCDTERTRNDTARGYERIIKRTGCNPDEEGNIQGLTLLMLRYCTDTFKMRKIINEYIETGKYSLLIIDGIADMVSSENDLEEAKGLFKWISSLSAAHCIGFVMTMHPNPDQSQGKAMGHLGTLLGKKCEAVLSLFKHDHAKDVRVISSSTSSSKIRNDDSDIYQEIIYDKELKMFVSNESSQDTGNPSWKQALIDRKIMIKDEFKRFIYYNHFNEKKSLSSVEKFIRELEELGEIVIMSDRIELPNRDMIRKEDIERPEESEESFEEYNPKKLPFISGGDYIEDQPF